MQNDSKPILYEYLKSGDLVFTGGRSLLSALIKLFTRKDKSNWENVATHVGLIIDFHGQKLIAEMLKDGLTISSLEEYRKNKRRFIIGIGRVIGLKWADVDRIEREIALDRRKSIEYDYLGILSFLTNNPDCPEKFYCSEYVADIYRRIGKPFIVKDERGLYSPESLYQLFSSNSTTHTLIKYE